MCHQVAAWVLDMFSDFNLVINHKIANNSTTAKAIFTDLDSLKFKKFFDSGLAKFKN
jgi:hypothetical protein